MTLKLDMMNRLPSGLTDLDLADIRSVFPNPTLINIEGAKEQPLFISMLLHGNETTSFAVLQYLYREYGDGELPRNLMIFVGNVEAAAEGVRKLDHSPDFNRIWGGGASEHHKLASQVTMIARKANLFASIDIHNNTGRNPLYGCVNTLRPADLELAALFASVGVYYLNPPTTQSIAFSKLCPAITVECGKSGEADGVEAAINLIERTMRLDDFDHTPPPQDQLKLYETTGRVVIDPDASISFGETQADLALRGDLETKNFHAMSEGDVWAQTSWPGIPMRVFNEHDEDLTGRFFYKQGEEIRLVRDAIPSMVTPDYDIIRQDCLCYLMEPL